MGMKKGVEESRTPDIAHHHYLIALKTHVLERLIKDTGNSFVGAPGAKDQRPAFVQ